MVHQKKPPAQERLKRQLLWSLSTFSSDNTNQYEDVYKSHFDFIFKKGGKFSMLFETILSVFSLLI